ncbi:hypothetical protein NQ318_002200 [Aromia moschata]|uniref:C2H2-type domain-containing protein n=1 Tax=Aromia moschata TaxID=1265417 RepID=A0AAV8Z3E1_9CUCU|nr:hypothetical protein NQ318_002200 [Aromia moschata]
MTQVMSADDEEVQYVLSDMELILDSGEIKAEGLSDIIYSDGTTAILVNEHGQIVQGETQTVVLQDGDDISQYYINDENGQILVADDQDASVSHSLDGTEVVQYIEDENTMDEPQVIYINEDGFAIQEPDLSEYQITEPQDDVNILPLKTVKLETQIVDLEELMQQQGENDTAIIENLTEENGYQYAVLKDGKLHIQSYNGEIFPLTSTDMVQEEQDMGQESVTNQEILDLSKITGRNLLTGQTVTLHSYMDKLQRKIRHSVTSTTKTSYDEGGYNHKRKKKEGDGLSALLNKRLSLGKTTNVRGISSQLKNGQLVNLEECGIESVNGDGSNDSIELEEPNNDSEVIQEERANEANELSKEISETNCDRKIIIHEKVVSKECFGHISRTLSGLMNMDSVKKKLQCKNIVVKVVEKRYNSSTKKYTKKVSYSSGYMQVEYSFADDGETSENWYFVPYQNSKEAIFGKSMDVDNNDDSKEESQKYSETTNITVMITQDKTNDHVIRVILSRANSNRCSICSREFRGHLQLRVHMTNVHKVVEGAKMCEICGEKFDGLKGLQEHRKEHVQEGELFQCWVEGCGKFFLTAGRLKRHSTVHNAALRPLECSVCLKRCSSESSLKKHLMTHMNVKPFYCETCSKSFSNPWDLNFHKRIHDPCKYYTCDICKRTFSRHSNLLRHVEIHKGAGQLFQCEICGCSYHYMSSLTRHVVQNHIKRTDGELLETSVSNEPDVSQY